MAVLGVHCCKSFSPICSAQASHCGGFPCCGARALAVLRSVVVTPKLYSTDSVVMAHAQASLLSGMWDLPGPGLEPLSPPLAGGFFTNEPLGKP